MNLAKHIGGWTISLSDARVQRIDIDFRLGLLIVDDVDAVSVVIESACCLQDGTAEMPLVPEMTASLAPILNYFNAAVREIQMHSAGELQVLFSDGSSLVVSPGENYEAWQVSCLGKFQFICLPGGRICEF